MPGSALRVHRGPEESRSAGRPRDQRGEISNPRFLPGDRPSPHRPDSNVPGLHAYRLATVGPAPAEVQVSDREQIERVDSAGGGDRLPPGEGEQERGGHEEQREQEKDIVGDRGKPAQQSHRPGGRATCRRRLHAAGLEGPGLSSCASLVHPRSGPWVGAALPVRPWAGSRLSGACTCPRDPGRRPRRLRPTPGR